MIKNCECFPQHRHKCFKLYSSLLKFWFQLELKEVFDPRAFVILFVKTFTYFFSMPCFSLTTSLRRRSRLSQRSSVSLNLAFMLLICQEEQSGHRLLRNSTRGLGNFRGSNKFPHLLRCLLLQVNDLVLPVYPLGLQLTGQQVRVLQTCNKSQLKSCATEERRNASTLTVYLQLKTINFLCLTEVSLTFILHHLSVRLAGHQPMHVVIWKATHFVHMNNNLRSDVELLSLAKNPPFTLTLNKTICLRCVCTRKKG